jgi:hypothetical protein
MADEEGTELVDVYGAFSPWASLPSATAEHADYLFKFIIVGASPNDPRSLMA